MAKAVIMPRQGQSVESCILTQWFKEVGDTVSTGDLLFGYETDKAAFEEEAKEEGILLARFYEEGDEVPVLVNVAVIGSEGEPVEQFDPRETTAGPSTDHGSDRLPKAEPSQPETVQPGPGQAELSIQTETIHDPVKTTPIAGGRIPVSPRARKMACEKRVRVEGVVGSGPGGRIIERDILEEIRKGKRLTPLARNKLEMESLAVPREGRAPYGKISSKELVKPVQAMSTGSVPAAQTWPAGTYTDTPLSNVRKIIAGAMYHSLQHSAQLTHHLGANASGMMRLRREVKKRMEGGYPTNITLNDMVCYAVVRALKLHPGANAHYLDGTIRQFSQVNLGLAVDTERGLLVPALTGADDLSLQGLSTRLRELVEASRTGGVSPDLLVPEAASFTVSNLGNYGVEMFTPVINLPQVAILGVNTIVQRPVTMEDGAFGFQPFIGLSLTYDHRAIDGGPATLFLASIRDQIESLTPDLL